ncbi:hypothetical protein RHECNPAF_13600111 [Rhizobium etli CNPAF512]|nr:hypothetical protein RHECNPAF_13600111 [Rhizobium etli CNPAF512]
MPCSRHRSKRQKSVGNIVTGQVLSSLPGVNWSNFLQI